MGGEQKISRRFKKIFMNNLIKKLNKKIEENPNFIFWDFDEGIGKDMKDFLLEAEDTNNKGKIFLVDLDGTLTKDIAWTPEQCLNCEPKNDIISKVNELHKTQFIVIWTARKDYLIPATLEWLRRNNVMYSAISNQKCGAFAYVDDKAIRPEEL